MSSKVSVFEQKINEAVGSLLLNEEPNTLFEPISYILSLGGKRLRPLLTLMAADLFGKNVDDVMDGALAMEIFHNFTLMHDDLMDRADVRRGKPVVHKKWNDNVAILSGDAMLIEAYKQIEKVPPTKLPEVLSIFSVMATDVCRGQQYDLDFEQRTNVSEADYIEMIRLKTAVLLACSLKMGAILADAPKKDAELLYQYGINIGLAFQLKDDLLDVYGNPETFGKKIGGDILCNKKTFLLINALQMADEAQKNEIESWLSKTTFEPEKKINVIRNIYDALHLKAISEKLIEQYYRTSLDCLTAINVPDERKKELVNLSENLMYRIK